MTTPDWYAEERFAGITSQAREGLQKMREGGEPEPVAFSASPDDEAGRAVLRALGFPDPAAGQPTPLVVLPKAQVAALLDEHVSRGVGSKAMGAGTPRGRLPGGQPVPRGTGDSRHRL